MVVLGALGWSAGAARAEEIHYHGFEMNSQTKLIFEQENGVVRITLVSRARPTTTEPDPTPKSSEEALLGRGTQRRVLAQARAEVLRPSAPNYLRNPGQRYRITVEGVEVCPDYAVKLDVDAAQARKTMEGEIRKLRDRASGIEREALAYATTMVPDILNQADRMPATLSETVLRSQVGRIRVTDKTFQRRPLPTGAPAGAGGTPPPNQSNMTQETPPQ